MKVWDWFWFGDKEYILIDNRMEPKAEYTHLPHGNKLYLTANPKHKWTPLCRLDYSERFTQQEFEKFAKIITDRLNAFEVEKKLKGE